MMDGRFSRLVCLAAIVWGGIHALAGVANAKPKDDRPNIVFLLADDLGWADLAHNGADLHETPHLDRLAKNGMRFDRAYASAPVCTPTRAAVLTGKHPARLRMTIWREAAAAGGARKDSPLVPPGTVGDLPHDEYTLAEALSDAGYMTAIVGKWHLGDIHHYPEAHGFDVNIGATGWGAPPTHFTPYKGFRGKEKREFRYVPGLSGGKPGEYLADRMTDEALKLMESSKDKPFFLFLSYYAVHEPIEAKAKDIAHYEKKLKPGQRHTNATYAAMVHNLDESVGRIVRKLDALGISKRTLLVFTSDNGGYLPVTNNDPLRSGKGTLYEGGVRVPFLARWPGVTKAGTATSTPVTTTDLFATFLDAARVAPEKAPRHADGASLMPLLKDPALTIKRDALYFHYPHYYFSGFKDPIGIPGTSVLAGDWKLIEFHDKKVELYNLKEDPSERKDVAAQEKARVTELRKRIHDFHRETNAQLATPRAKVAAK